MSFYKKTSAGGGGGGAGCQAQSLLAATITRMVDRGQLVEPAICFSELYDVFLARKKFFLRGARGGDSK